MFNYSKEIDIAIKAVRKSADICRAVQRDLVKEDSLSKKDKSPVTVADFASQAIVCATLKKAFGDILIVGEENANQLRQVEQSELRKSVIAQVRAALGQLSENEVLSLIDSGGAEPNSNTNRFWTIDPIDGTKGFLRKQQYAIALALVENGKVVVGALACPNLPVNSTKMDKNNPAGTLSVATKDESTLMYKLPVDSNEPLGKPFILNAHKKNSPIETCFCESVDSGHSDQSWSANIASSLGISAPPVRIDSQAKYAVVARGGASIYLRLPVKKDYQENIWDHAAGKIIVEQAGGKVTDINGQELDFSCGRALTKNEGVVATFGENHSKIVQTIANQRP